MMLKYNKIHFIDVLDGLKQINDKTVDIIIADPPYNIGKDFGNSKFNMSTEEYVKWCMKWIEESKRILKASGTMFIYGFSEILAHLSVQFPTNKQRWLIWHYTNKTVPKYNFWQRSHESILVTWKGDERIFNRDLIREPYTEKFLKNSAGKTRTNTKGRFSRGDKTTIYKAHKGGALPRDVIMTPALAGGAGREKWFFCKDCKKTCFAKDVKKHANHETLKHPTQKPIALTKKLILSCMSEEEGLVVVPFSGSGSEFLVSRQMGLNCIGFDINRDYVKMANSLIRLV